MQPDDANDGAIREGDPPYFSNTTHRNPTTHAPPMYLRRWLVAGLIFGLVACAASGYTEVITTKYHATPRDQAILVVLAYGPIAIPIVAVFWVGFGFVLGIIRRYNWNKRLDEGNSSSDG